MPKVMRTLTGGLMLFLVTGLGVVAPTAQAADAAGRLVKLDTTGNELPADAASWAMVKDTKTDLVWENKSTDGSIHDAGNQYTWQESKEVFVAELNATKFGGFSDWRMPNDTEIASIKRMNKEEPFVDTDYFPNIQPANYWNYYVCGSGEIMNEAKSFGKKSVRSPKQRVIAVRGKEN